MSMGLKIEPQISLITPQIHLSIINRDIIHSRQNLISIGEIILGSGVAVGEQSRGQARDGVIFLGHAVRVSARGVGDEVCEVGESDFGGAVGVLFRC